MNVHLPVGKNIGLGVSAISDEELILIKHVSFVDCPGHESFMSTMVSGTSTFDATFPE